MRSLPSSGLIQGCGYKCSASCLYLPSLWTDTGLGMLGVGNNYQGSVQGAAVPGANFIN